MTQNEANNISLLQITQYGGYYEEGSSGEVL